MQYNKLQIQSEKKVKSKFTCSATHINFTKIYQQNVAELCHVFYTSKLGHCGNQIRQLEMRTRCGLMNAFLGSSEEAPPTPPAQNHPHCWRKISSIVILKNLVGSRPAQKGHPLPLEIEQKFRVACCQHVSNTVAGARLTRCCFFVATVA